MLRPNELLVGMSPLMDPKVILVIPVNLKILMNPVIFVILVILVNLANLVNLVILLILVNLSQKAYMLIYIIGGSVDSGCRELQENVWLVWSERSYI